MIEIKITRQPVSPAFQALFTSALEMPAGLRCAGVLDGLLPGRILTDDSTTPTWAVLQETTYGTIYPVGAINAKILAEIVTQLGREGEVLMGFWPEPESDNPMAQIAPSDFYYDGTILDFMDSTLAPTAEQLLRQIPDGCAVRRVDAKIFQQIEDRDSIFDYYGSVDTALKNIIGYVLMRGDDLLCEAVSGPAIRGRIEIGVATHDSARRQGYATVTCASLIQECERLGYTTYWNCNAQNLASVALARKLGYKNGKQYRLLAWSEVSK